MAVIFHAFRPDYFAGITNKIKDEKDKVDWHCIIDHSQRV